MCGFSCLNVFVLGCGNKVAQTHNNDGLCGGPNRWSNFHGMIPPISIHKAFGPLTRCIPNVDQEE